MFAPNTDAYTMAPQKSIWINILIRNPYRILPDLCLSFGT